MKKAICCLTMVSILGLTSACGNTTQDRALSGAGLGAAAGAVGGALVGGSMITGTVIGAGVGAAAGALTDNGDINFGKPAWR